jgi:hypothetical protein
MAEKAVASTGDKPKIIYWRRWQEQFGEPRTGTLKYALLNRKETGFNRCVRLINGRIYLDVEETFAFFNSCREIKEEESNESGSKYSK